MATILQVLPSMVSGGVERGVIDIAKFLARQRHKSLVLSAGGPMVSQLEEAGIQHITLNVASKNPLIIWKNIEAITNIIKTFEVDIVHARSRAPAWSCYYACRRTKIRFVTTVHGVYNTNFLKRLYNNIMTKGDEVIAVSNWVKDYLTGNYNIGEDKITVIHRGTDTNYFNPKNIDQNKLAAMKIVYGVPEGACVLLLPGRLTEWKGHKILLDALSKLKKESFYCLIVGDKNKRPDYVAELQKNIDLLKLPVKIFDTEQDMAHLYLLSDIVISPSTRPEAFGRVITEAQSMSKLVIASNIGGAAETIQNEVNGFHFSCGNAGDLSDKISYAFNILGTTKHAEVIAAARSCVVNNYSLQKMQEKTLEIYQKLL